jgi:hypothetical protein
MFRLQVIIRQTCQYMDITCSVSQYRIPYMLQSLYYWIYFCVLTERYFSSHIKPSAQIRYVRCGRYLRAVELLWSRAHSQPYWWIRKQCAVAESEESVPEPEPKKRPLRFWSRLSGLDSLNMAPKCLRTLIRKSSEKQPPHRKLWGCFFAVTRFWWNRRICPASRRCAS